MDELKARQDLYNGFGDTLARGFEIAVMPFLFGGIGFVADRLMGTTPVVTVVASAFCLIGLSIRTYYGYDAEMRAHEAAAPWSRGVQASGARRRGERGRRPPTMVAEPRAGHGTGGVNPSIVAPTAGVLPAPEVAAR